MKSYPWFFGVGVFLLLATLLVHDGSAQKGAKPLVGDMAAPSEVCVAQIQRGGHLYRAYCGRCHGLDGTGGGPDGAGLNAPPPDLLIRAMGDVDVKLVSVIREGHREMPGWKNSLNEEGVWAIIGWLRTR